MFPAWTWVVGLFLGATIGSFLNVVIYRLPRGLSLANPPKSFCPRCKASLGPADLFPLLSYLFLRGKCRHCGVRVPFRYFFVELLNGAIWAGIWAQYLGPDMARWDPPQAIAYMLAAAALVAVIFIDWELFIIPDQVNAFLLFVGLGFNGWLIAQGDPSAWTLGVPSSVVGALLGIGVIWLMAFLGRVIFGRDAMGHGDIKLARGIGAVLFPMLALGSFGLAIVFGAILGVAQVFLRRGQEEVTGGEPEDVEEGYEPESIGSLVFCGLGYVLLIDVIGLFIPKLYERWFGENPYLAIEEEEDFAPGATMIPFGPYLALGAIAAVVFQSQLQSWVQMYMDWAFPREPQVFLEQIVSLSSLFLRESLEIGFV